MTYDPKTLETIPEAAKCWTISEDKLTYTFTLRDDLFWSDGKPMTSADYKWTFDQAIKPDNSLPVHLEPRADRVLRGARTRRRSSSS